jgi:hypothetical protein
MGDQAGVQLTEINHRQAANLKIETTPNLTQKSTLVNAWPIALRQNSGRGSLL